MYLNYEKEESDNESEVIDIEECDKSLFINNNVTHYNTIFELLNLNKYPSISRVIQFQNDSINPYDMNQIFMDDDDYFVALNNFFEYQIIPKNHKLYINGIWIYLKLNTHGISSFYAYPAGYNKLNCQNCYPYATSAFQISLMEKCTNHNAIYNQQYQTKVQIERDEIGRNITNYDLIITAYVAPDKTTALKQIIYLLANVYNYIRPEYYDFNYFFQFSDSEEKNLIIKKNLDRNYIRFQSRIGCFFLNQVLGTKDEGEFDIF